MTSYVVGFLFDHNFDNVVLLRKTKPSWQKGRWNGVGGKIEEGEAPVEAMQREFLEETGKEVSLHKWTEYARLHGAGWEVFVFCADDTHQGVTTKTEELVERWGVMGLLNGSTPIPLLGGIRWQLQMALSILRQEESCHRFDIEEVR